jgi:hypothetical protein
MLVARFIEPGWNPLLWNINKVFARPRQSANSSSMNSRQDIETSSIPNSSLATDVEGKAAKAGASPLKTALLALLGLVLVGLCSGAVYVFILDKSGDSKSMLMKALGVHKARPHSNSGVNLHADQQGTSSVLPNVPVVSKALSKASATVSPSSSKTPIIIISVVFVLILAGVAVGVYFFYRKTVEDQEVAMHGYDQLSAANDRKEQERQQSEQQQAEENAKMSTAYYTIYSILSLGSLVGLYFAMAKWGKTGEAVVILDDDTPHLTKLFRLLVNRVGIAFALVCMFTLVTAISVWIGSGLPGPFIIVFATFISGIAMLLFDKSHRILRQWLNTGSWGCGGLVTSFDDFE